MNEQRYKQLMEDDSVKLTPEEISHGWHFCYEFDGLLVGPGMHEQQFCKCKRTDLNEERVDGIEDRI